MYFFFILLFVWIFGAIVFGLATQDAENSGLWLLVGLLPVFLALVILGAMSGAPGRDFDKYPIVVEDTKMSIATIGGPSQLVLIPKPHQELGRDLFQFEKDGMSLFIVPARISILPGDEFYIRKLVKRAPASWFYFRDTKTRYYLVLPERVLK